MMIENKLFWFYHNRTNEPLAINDGETHSIMNPNKKLITDYIASLTDKQKNNILFQLIVEMIDF